MPDREKVIKGLEECSKADFNPCVDRVCPYAPKNTNNFCNCRIHLLIDALALLKEDCHNCKLECLLQRYDELKEKYDKLLTEQTDEIKELRSMVEFWKEKALHTQLKG